MEQCRNKDYRLSTFETVPHCFYSGFVGRVPSMRVSKENPAMEMRSFIADIDAKLSFEVLIRAIESIPETRRPRFLESTLSDKWRLVFPLERPFSWGSLDDPSRLWDEFLKLLAGELKLTALFAESLDKKSMTTTQVWWNHCNWSSAGDAYFLRKELIDKIACDAFDKVSRRHKVAQGRLSNLEAAKEELGRRYPRFLQEWDPENFKIGARGSSFWITGSQSPLSAIVKEEGIFTFADHADRSFYSWKDLLGEGYVDKDHSDRDYNINRTYYFNDTENRFYKLKNGSEWLTLTPEAVRQELVLLGLSPRVERDGGDLVAEVDQCIIRLRNMNQVSGKGPFMWNPERIIQPRGSSKRYLNSFYEVKPIPPTAERTPWGPEGKFPTISWLVDHLFEGQDRDMWLSYAKIAYIHFLERKKQLKQALIVAGPQGTGKTLLQTGVLSALLGGHGQGNGYLTMETRFCGEMFDHAVICVDDGEGGTTQAKQRQMTERLKTLVSKSGVTVEEKFKTTSRGEWFGVITISVNTDVGSLHNSMPDTTMAIADKLIILRVHCPATDDREGLLGMKQPEWEKVIAQEIAYFAAWLYHTYQIPDWAISRGRYELVPYHNEMIMTELEHMSEYFLASRIMTKAMRLYFGSDPEGVKKDTFTGDPLEVWSLVAPLIQSSREMNQQSFLKLLMKFVQSSRVPNSWLHYDRLKGKWTVYKSRLPA
jgi:hypothetical protein